MKSIRWTALEVREWGERRGRDALIKLLEGADWKPGRLRWTASEIMECRDKELLEGSVIAVDANHVEWLANTMSPRVKIAQPGNVEREAARARLIAEENRVYTKADGCGHC